MLTNHTLRGQKKRKTGEDKGSVSLKQVTGRNKIRRAQVIVSSLIAVQQRKT